MGHEFRFQTSIDSTSTSPTRIHPTNQSSGNCDSAAVAVTCSAGAMLAWRLEAASDEAQANFIPLNDDVISYDIPTTVRHTINAGVAYTDDTANVTDGNAATNANWDALDTLANGDWAVAGYSTRFNGLFIDMDAANVNANASVLTVQYWDGVTWTSVGAIVDGTIVAGATLAQDGLVTWTMPANWRTNTVDGVTAYHVRCIFSAALSAQVDVDEVRVLLDANRYIGTSTPTSALRLVYAGVTGTETITVDTTLRRYV